MYAVCCNLDKQIAVEIAQVGCGAAVGALAGKLVLGITAASGAIFSVAAIIILLFSRALANAYIHDKSLAALIGFSTLLVLMPASGFGACLAMGIALSKMQIAALTVCSIATIVSIQIATTPKEPRRF